MYYRTSCSKFCCALMILFVSQKMFKFIMLFSFLYSVWMRGRLIFMLKWKNLRARQVSNWVFLNLWCSVNFWDCWQLVTDQSNWCRLSTVHQWLTKWKMSLQWFHSWKLHVPHHPRWRTQLWFYWKRKLQLFLCFIKVSNGRQVVRMLVTLKKVKGIFYGRFNIKSSSRLVILFWSSVWSV